MSCSDSFKSFEIQTFVFLFYHRSGGILAKFDFSKSNTLYKVCIGNKAV